MKVVDGDATALVVGMDGVARVWDLAQNREARVLMKDANFRCLATSSDGGRVVLCDSKGTATLLSKDKILKQVKSHSVHGGPAVLAKSGAFAIVSGGDSRFADRVVCTVKFWDLTTNKLKHQFGPTHSFVTDMILLPDERTLVTVGGHRSDKPVECVVRIWEVHTGKLLAELGGHTDSIKWVSVNLNGDRLLTGSADGTVRLWDLPKRSQVMEISVPGVWCGAIAPDGKRCVVGAGTQAIVFDLETKKEVSRFTEHRALVTNVGFLTNGTDAYSVSGEGMMAFWRSR